MVVEFIFLVLVIIMILMGSGVVLVIPPIKADGSKGIVGRDILRSHPVDSGQVPWFFADKLEDVIFVDIAVEVAVESADGFVLVHGANFVDSFLESFDEVPKALVLFLDDGL